MNKNVFYPLENNYQKIKKIFGEDFLIKSIEDKIELNDFLECNEVLSQLVYGKEIASLILDRNIDKIKKMYEEVEYKNLKYNFEKEFNLDEVGAILIRPETFGIIELYKKFLEEKGLSIIIEKMIKPTFEQYWILYNEGILKGLESNDPFIDFATRTFNYINNNCYLIVFKKQNKLNTNLPTSDYIMQFKGKHGSYCFDTLRGDIAFNSLSPYVVDGKTLIKSANVPLDPIGAYRLLVRDIIKSDGCHNRFDFPILFYAGQSVHIPDRTEINKNLNALCDENDIKTLIKKIK